MENHGYVCQGAELPSYMFYPRFLLDTDLNDTARLIYVLLLDRARLSVENGWEDERGAYVYFTIRELGERTRRSKTVVTESLRALEEAALIHRIQQGNNAPNRIYVRFPTEEGGSTGKPATRSAGKPATRSAGKPASRSAGKPAPRSTGKPASRSTGKPAPNKNYRIRTTQQEPGSKQVAAAAAEDLAGLPAWNGKVQRPRPEHISSLDWIRANSRKSIEEMAEKLWAQGKDYVIPATVFTWPTLEELGVKDRYVDAPPLS